MKGSPDRYFTADGYIFDLERVANEMTTESPTPGAVPIVRGNADGSSEEITLQRATIDAWFDSEVANLSEIELKLRLALVRYFLQTGKPLLPQMVSLLIAGISDVIKDGKPWPREAVKDGTPPDDLIMVAAISKRFRGSKPDIAAALELSVSAVSERIKRAKSLMNSSAYYGVLFERLVRYLPEKKLEAIDLLEPSKQEEFICQCCIKVR